MICVYIVIKVQTYWLHVVSCARQLSVRVHSVLMLGVQVDNVAYFFCLVVLVDGIGLRLACFFPEVF